MNGRRLVLSKIDYARLVDAMQSDLVRAILTESDWKRWKARLTESQIVEPRQHEPVVTIGSVVELLDTTSGIRETFRLVFPEDANIRDGKLSVFAPKGESLLGARLGEVVTWKSVSVARRLSVEAICGPSGSAATRASLATSRS